MWLSPNVPQIVSSDIWKNLLKAFDGAIRVGAVEKREHPTRQLFFPNGGSIIVRSATEGVRGAGLDGVVLDEAAQMDREVWTEVVRPALIDRQGWALFQSTPKGLNWFHDLFNDAGRLDLWKRWQRPSSDNPIVTVEELEHARAIMGPRAFAQEHLAQFMEIEGALWPADYFGAHVWSEDWPDRFQRSAIAVDPSMGQSEKSDLSAIVHVGLSRGLLWVDCDIARRPPGELVAATVAMRARYACPIVGVEANGFQAVLRDLFDQHCREQRIPPLPLVLVHNRDKKLARIQRIDPYLAGRKIRLRRTAGNQTLLDQLIMFPQGEHDDGPDALEMAIRLLNQYRPARSVEEVLVP